MFERVYCIRVMRSNCTGAVVPDGSSQVWQIPGVSHGRLQCLKEGTGAALSGWLFDMTPCKGTSPT